MKPVVTEQTGKNFKGMMLVAMLVCCVSVVLIVSGTYSSVGVLGFLVGIVLYFVGRIGAWWNHA